MYVYVFCYAWLLQARYVHSLVIIQQRNRRGVAQSEVVRVLPSEVYFEMNELEQINED